MPSITDNCNEQWVHPGVQRYYRHQPLQPAICHGYQQQLSNTENCCLQLIDILANAVNADNFVNSSDLCFCARHSVLRFYSKLFPATR